MHRTAIALLKAHEFRHYFIGRSAVLLGNSMAPVALTLTVLEKSASLHDLAISLAARSISIVVFLLVGGAISDRYPRSRVLALSNLGSALSQGAIAGNIVLGHYEIRSFAALQFTSGALEALTLPASRGITPQIVPKDLLRQGNALLSASRSVCAVAGPSAAAGLVATVGGGCAAATTAALFTIASVCMRRIRLPDPQLGKDSSSLIADMAAGWSAFARCRWIWWSVCSCAILNAVRAGIWFILGPAIVNSQFGPAGWGLISSANGAGIVIGSAIMYRLNVRYLLGVGRLVVATTGMLPLVILGLHPTFLLITGAALLAGSGLGVYGIAWETTLQRHIPNQELSRVSAYDDLYSFLAIPVGQIIVGPLTVMYGTHQVILVAGIIYLLAGLAPLSSPVVRGLRDNQPVTASKEEGLR